VFELFKVFFYFLCFILFLPGDNNLIEEENNQGRGTNNTGTL
jgi:hypothetical protein